MNPKQRIARALIIKVYGADVKQENYYQFPIALSSQQKIYYNASYSRYE
jgi:hypothetical protein